MGKDVIRAASWDPHQPNRLALILRGGVKVASQPPFLPMHLHNDIIINATIIHTFIY
jgi:hypothetical protein